MFESGLETAEAAEIEAVIDTREPNRRQEVGGSVGQERTVARQAPE